MSITLTDLLTDFRIALNETVAQFWTNAELTSWANDALRDIARQAEVLQDIVTIPLVSSQQQYTAPKNLLRVHYIEYAQSSSYRIPLEFVPFQNMSDMWYTSRTVAGGNPYLWSYWGYPGDDQVGQIYIYPAPSSATGSLNVFYYRLPRKMVLGTDIADLPAGWEDLVTNYVEAQGRRKDNDPRWKEAQDMYQQGLQQMMSVTRQPSDQQTYVGGQTGGGFSQWWSGLGD